MDALGCAPPPEPRPPPRGSPGEGQGPLHVADADPRVGERHGGHGSPGRRRGISPSRRHATAMRRTPRNTAPTPPYWTAARRSRSTIAASPTVTALKSPLSGPTMATDPPRIPPVYAPTA